MAKFKCNICGQTFEADKMPDKCPICQADSSNIEAVEEAGAKAAAPKKKGIDTNSNVYTIIYAAVLVVIVAFLLAFVSSALKPTQDANVLRDTKNQILISLNIEGLKGEAVDAKYNEVIVDTIESDGKQIYQANLDGATKYVFPVTGRGLWGGLWGYISVDDDKAHVFGTYFSHESETAGLGARINERWFQQQFNGKPIFGADGNVALTVVKAGSAAAETDVDGVTGATLTSKGVAAMVTEGLSAYKSFLGGAAAEAPAEGGCHGCCKAEGGCPMAAEAAPCDSCVAAGGCQKAEGECCGKCQEGAEAACPMAEGHCGKCEKGETK